MELSHEMHARIEALVPGGLAEHRMRRRLVRTLAAAGGSLPLALLREALGPGASVIIGTTQDWHGVVWGGEHVSLSLLLAAKLGLVPLPPPPEPPLDQERISRILGSEMHPATSGAIAAARFGFDPTTGKPYPDSKTGAPGPELPRVLPEPANPDDDGPDPFADIRPLVGRCKNIATVEEAMAHAGLVGVCIAE